MSTEPAPPFITFEGGEGAGKSTQIKLLATALEAAGQPILCTRQPGGTEKGAQLRELLLNGPADKWSPMAETLLMLADRQVHLEEMIRPALAEGKWVLCDRYMDSTTAYQGAAGKLGLDVIHQLQTPIIGDNVPDMTILLDLDVKQGLSRATERGGEARFEAKGQAYHQIIRECFLTLAQQEASRFFVIDATQDSQIIHQRVLTEVHHRFGGASI